MNVKIYTIPTCPWCDKAKEWLTAKNVAFQEIDLTDSEQGRDEILAKTGQQGVPVIEIGETIIIGFHEDKMSKALGK